IVAIPTFVALCTGLRRGELLALRSDDVDLERGPLHVRRSLEQLKGGKCAFKQPKTKKSRRVVPLQSAAVAALRQVRAKQSAIKLRLRGYNAGALVFPDPESDSGEPWGPDRFSASFYYRARKAGFAISFHGLRHSFATIALRAGVPMKTVSEALGHTTTAITADIYTHVAVDSLRQASDLIGDAIGAARKKLALANG
ncbi:MAG: site-specific integrase, partial [Vulcanimicrobiaceae bacterium]